MEIDSRLYTLSNGQQTEGPCCYCGENCRTDVVCLDHVLKPVCGDCNPYVRQASVVLAHAVRRQGITFPDADLCEANP